MQRGDRYRRPRDSIGSVSHRIIMTLYTILVRLLRLINHLYFVDVRSSGREHVPASGPVLLAANHPGSILDSVLMTTQIPRPIRFLARSGLFRIPVLATFFRQMGAIPIYRSSETKGATTRNREVFEKVYELFEEGGCVGIFPEGKNAPRTQVTPIRTGTARMALGAEARNDYELGLVIVPVGINFESRDLLTAAVLLRFGTPIRVSDYAEMHRSQPDQAVQQLTADVQAALQRQAMHIEDEKAQALADDLASVLGDKVAAAMADTSAEEAHDRSWGKRFVDWVLGFYQRTTSADSYAFELRMLRRKYIYDVLHRASQAAPEAVTALRNRVERYKDHLRQNQLRAALSDSFEDPVRERLLRLRMTLYAVGMAPIAAFGFVHNAVPYLFTKLTARQIDDEAIRGFAYFTLGIVAFGATYTALGVGMWRYTSLSWAQSLAYVALLPPTGFAVLTYRRTILLYRDRILVRTFLWNESDRAFLQTERKAIAQRFYTLAETYGPEVD